MEVELIKPYGFCVGVKYVIDQLNDIISKHSNESVFCVGQLVHNQNVVNSLKDKGVIILDEDKDKAIDKISSGVVVFSAHGTDEKIIKKAKDKGLIVYDLACPFVKKSFYVIKNKLNDNYDVIYIGVKNHDESNAALSISSKIHFVTNIDDVNKLKIDNNKICIINQTTLSIIDIKDIYNKIIYKYPNAIIIDEICASTRTRQQIIIDKKIKSKSLIIVGDTNSNNTRSLYNIAKSNGYDTILVNDLSAINKEWIKEKKSIAVMSGASTSFAIVEEICEAIKKY